MTKVFASFPPPLFLISVGPFCPAHSWSLLYNVCRRSQCRVHSIHTQTQTQTPASFERLRLVQRVLLYIKVSSPVALCALMSLTYTVMHGKDRFREDEVRAKGRDGWLENNNDVCCICDLVQFLPLLYIITHLKAEICSWSGSAYEAWEDLFLRFHAPSKYPTPNKAVTKWLHPLKKTPMNSLIVTVTDSRERPFKSESEQRSRAAQCLLSSLFSPNCRSVPPSHTTGRCTQNIWMHVCLQHRPPSWTVGSRTYNPTEPKRQQTN